MEKRIEDDFEFKLKFLNFFIWSGSCPPPSTFHQKWKLGSLTPWFTVLILFRVIENYFYNYLKTSAILMFFYNILLNNCRNI